VTGLIPRREVIGPQECPLFYRWTLLAPRIRGRVPFKLMVHRFLPNRTDADVPHDHPRSFLTVVLRGGYVDWIVCPRCRGRLFVPEPGIGWERARHTGEFRACLWCRDDLNMPCGVVVGEQLRAPAVRFRHAEHAHMTETHDRGAWTVVVMGPESRRWGFWRRGEWWPFREFEQRFGFTWRCEEPEQARRRLAALS
jgi:hypothetical protein